MSDVIPCGDCKCWDQCSSECEELKEWKEKQKA